jgi:hypothetical protein
MKAFLDSLFSQIRPQTRKMATLYNCVLPSVGSRHDADHQFNRFVAARLLALQESFLSTNMD